ncbi:mucin-3A [Prionailurus iriomotensis]
MEVSVDQEISPDLNDNTSKAYEDFSDTFWDQDPGISDAEDLPKCARIRGCGDPVPEAGDPFGAMEGCWNGSIVVPFSLQLESEYEKVKTVLKEELQNVSHNGDSCRTLCFRPDSIKVTNDTRKELTLEAICRCATAKGYEDFFFPSVEEYRLWRRTGSAVSPNARRAWMAPSTVTKASALWRGAVPHAVQVAVAWRALVGGLTGAAALRLVALSIFVLGRRRTCDEDTVGTFSDLGLEDERTVKDENFQVALEDVDINVSVRVPRGDGEELSQIQVQKPSRQSPGQGPG